MTLTEINKILKKLNEKGFVSSLRKGPTGIGHLIETEFGLSETNVAVKDIGGRVEIKATRRDANSLITLFTFNRGVWRIKLIDLINNYGYIDEKGRMSLYNTVYFGLVNSHGFYLTIDRPKSLIILNNEKQENIAEWSIFSVTGKFMYKLDRILLILADSKTVGDRELFHFNEAYLLEEPTPNNFLKAFEDRKVMIDLRMHIKESGGVRNHGTGFRMAEKDLVDLYNKKRRLI